jgi:hypothetical protein
MHPLSRTLPKDLLINLSRAAAKSDFGLNPYPEVRDPKRPTEFLFDTKAQDMAFVNQVLDAFPTMSEASASREQMASAFAARDAAALPLLRWIISSNTSHIEKLPSHRLIEGMGTEHQCVISSSPWLCDQCFIFLCGRFLHWRDQFFAVVV